MFAEIFVLVLVLLLVLDPACVQLRGRRRKGGRFR